MHTYIGEHDKTAAKEDGMAVNFGRIKEYNMATDCTEQFSTYADHLELFRPTRQRRIGGWQSFLQIITLTLSSTIGALFKAKRQRA